MADGHDALPFASQPMYDVRQVRAYVDWLNSRISALESENRRLRRNPEDRSYFRPTEGEVGVHLVLTTPTGVSTDELDQTLQSTHDLLTTALYVAMLGYDFRRRMSSDDAQRLSGSLSLQDERAWEVAARTSANARIHSLSYGSPLDILYLISGSTLVASLAVTRMFSAFQNLQDARVAKTKADTQITAQRAIQQAIEQNGGQFEFINRLASKEIQNAISALDRVQLSEAIEATGRITTVEIDPVLANRSD